ncbi:MAG: hypothetical protein B6247_29360 [Candidatus Parabeggiatoa sp. nov. 2]|nr:MAG: hypothetical protein B6247_29360 [Beggiatoa sp. 4572_84]
MENSSDLVGDWFKNREASVGRLLGAVLDADERSRGGGDGGVAFSEVVKLFGEGNHKGLPLHDMTICRGNPLWLPLT